MPGAGTKVRTVRVDDALWEEAQRVAVREGVTLADVMREALTKFVAHPTKVHAKRKA